MSDDSPAAGVPDPSLVLRQTNWAALDHARGPAEDAPRRLVELTADDPHVAAEAVAFLECFDHQNSAYPATAPAAVYVAGLLGGPSTMRVARIRRPPFWHPEPLLVRVALLDWLRDVADDAEDPRLAGHRAGLVAPLQRIVATERERHAAGYAEHSLHSWARTSGNGPESFAAGAGDPPF